VAEDSSTCEHTGVAPCRSSDIDDKDTGVPTLPEHIVAVDPSTRAVFARAMRIANASCTVLITGETGTGKEILAQIIHGYSPRRHQPFVPVNCGGLPEALVESELFGYRKGAFTGALSDKLGLAEAADGGVLFLDEIGEMALPAQAHLLRFLDTGQIVRLGDTHARSVSVRVIAATNRNVERDVERGSIRRDLFYRLRGVPLHIPPLRERPEDIRALAAHFLRRCASQSGHPVKVPSEDAWTWLHEYPWPGNVRELKHVIQAATAMSTGSTITRLDLIEAIGLARGAWVQAPGLDDDADERQRVTAALESARGNRTHAAKALGIGRTTLWRSLRRLGIAPETSGRK